MKALIKFSRLSWGSRAMLAETALAVLGARVALLVVPIRKILRWSTVERFPSHAISSPMLEAELSRFVRAAGRRIPGATCLTQALALRYLLQKRGIRSELEIGVGKDANGFKAHAWLAVEGRVIHGGGRQLEDYERLSLRKGASL